VKAETSRSLYSSSAGSSESESRIAFCDIGLSFVAEVDVVGVEEVSETWKRSRIWSVPSESRFEFC
jgi:hypothetical protein